MRLSAYASVTVILLASTLTVAYASESHLFYLHGCCIKDGNDPKVRAYEKIVRQLKESGFNVTFELRHAELSDSDESAQAHAAKIADQVRTLLAKGTPPERITVAGYSLGSLTTMVASSHINNPKVNFVLLAGCPIKPAIRVNIDYTKVNGRVLSIIDAGDPKFGSCQGKLPQGITYKEIVLDSGKGHAVFRLADEKYQKLWMDPLIEWSKNN